MLPFCRTIMATPAAFTGGAGAAAIENARKKQ
jgi:hypothetical protein